jgi:hypothetical protein
MGFDVAFSVSECHHAARCREKQAAALRKSLSSHGWAVVEVEQPFENEWWAADIWRIESE